MVDPGSRRSQHISISRFIIYNTITKLWNYIIKLPHELVGQKVIGILSVKDLVNLDSALINRTVRSEFLLILQHCLPLKYHPQLKGYEWLKKKKCRISSISLLLSQTDIFQIDTSIIETIELHINGIPKEHEINQLNVKHNLKKITQLQISNIEENNGTMINKLISLLINLKKITITAITASNLIWINNLNIIPIKLEAIEIYTPILSNNLGNYITHCSKLRSLQIWNVINWEQNPNIVLEALGRNCNNLEYLYIYNPSTIQIHDNGIIGLAQGCKYLHSLYILQYDYMLITDYSIIELTKNCNNLQTISMNKANKLTHNSLITISEYKLPIKQLDIPWIPIDSIEVALQCAHALSRITNLPTSIKCMNLCLPYMTSITNITIDDTMDLYKAETLLTNIAVHCKCIHTISVYTSTNIILEQLIILASNNTLKSVAIKDASILTDIVLAELAKYCPRLKHISISKCTLLTDTSLIALSEHCTILYNLYITHSSLITDNGLIALSEKCSQLTIVTILDCKQIGNHNFSLFIQKCIKLQSFIVRNCPEFNDSCIINISKYCYQLQELIIENCDHITEASIIELVKKCHKLSRLIVPSSILSVWSMYQLQHLRNKNIYNTGNTVLRIYRR